MKNLDISRIQLIKQIGTEFQNGKGVEVGTFKGEFSKKNTRKLGRYFIYG